MKRDEFMPIMEKQIEIVQRLFNQKNKGYGAEDEVFHNFKETARRVHNSTSHEDMWKVILTYMDKHMVALAKGIDEYEFVNRLRDIIVYSLLAIGLHEEWESAQRLMDKADDIMERQEETNESNQSRAWRTPKG